MKIKYERDRLSNNQDASNYQKTICISTLIFLSTEMEM